MYFLFDFELNLNLRCDKFCYYFFLDFFRVIFNLGFIFFLILIYRIFGIIKDKIFKCDG